MAMPPPLSDGTGDWFSNFQNYFVRYVSSKLKHPPSSHGNAERVEHMRIFLMRTAMEIGLLEVGRILVKVFLISEENGGGDEMFSTAEMRDLTSLEEEAGDIFEFKEGRLVSVVEKCFKQDPLEALGLPTSTENTSVNQMVLEENLKLKNRVAEGDTFSTLKSLLLSVAQVLNGNEKGDTSSPDTAGERRKGAANPTREEASPDSFCDICGKKLKNAHGVAIHKGRMHRDVVTQERTESPGPPLSQDSGGVGSVEDHHHKPPQPTEEADKQTKETNATTSTPVYNLGNLQQRSASKGGPSVEASFACDFCGEMFKSAFDVSVHKGRMHKNEPSNASYPFQGGGFSLGETEEVDTPDKNPLRFNYASTQQAPPPSVDPSSVCDICGKFFKNAHGVAIHKGRMHKNEPSNASYPFQVGGFSLGETEELDTPDENPLRFNYASTQQAPPPSVDPSSVCDICGKVFKNAHGVAIHKGRMHKEDIRGNDCQFCSQKFRNQNELATHVENVHSNVDALVQEQSQAVLRASYTLQPVATNAQKVRAAANMRELLRMLVEHTLGESVVIHSDQIEVKRSNQVASLWKYVLRLTLPPACLKHLPYCAQCGQRFERDDLYQSHKLKHLYEPSMVCDFCLQRIAVPPAQSADGALIAREVEMDKHIKAEHATVDYLVAESPTFTRATKARQCIHYLSLKTLFPDQLNLYMQLPRPDTNINYEQLINEESTNGITPSLYSHSTTTGEDGVADIHFKVGATSFLEQCEELFRRFVEEDVRFSWTVKRDISAFEPTPCPICNNEFVKWSAFTQHIKDQHMAEENMVVHFPPPGFEVTISFDTPERRPSGVGLHRSVAEAFVIALLDLANNMQGKSRAAETVRAGITQMWEEFLRLDPPATNIATELAVFLFDAFFGTLSASDTELSTHAGKKQRLVGALVSQSTQERQRDCWSSRVALQTSRTLAADVYGVIGKGNSDMGETDGVLITLGAGRDARKQNAYEKALFHATVLAFSPNLKNAYKNTVEELDDLPNKAQRPTVKAQRQLEVKRSFLETILGYKR